MPCQQRRNSITDLIELTCLTATKFKPIRKTLQTRGFANEKTATATIRQSNPVHIASCPGKVAAG